MKRVRVLIPFQDKVTGKYYDVGDNIEVSEDRLAEIKAVNINMVLVIGDVKKTTARSVKGNA